MLLGSPGMDTVLDPLRTDQWLLRRPVDTVDGGPLSDPAQLASRSTLFIKRYTVCLATACTLKGVRQHLSILDATNSELALIIVVRYYMIRDSWIMYRGDAPLFGTPWDIAYLDIPEVITDAN